MDQKKMQERSDLNALLAHLLAWEQFKPDSINGSERPDFIITVQGRKIGVETTRSDPEEAVRASHLQSESGLWLNRTHLKVRGARRTNKELKQSMGYEAITQRWQSPEEFGLELGSEVVAALTPKQQKLNQAGYQIFDENWLLIYRKWPLAPYEDIKQIAAVVLNRVFRKSSGLERNFDMIFLLSGDWLFRWQNRTLAVFDSKQTRPQ